MKESEHETKDVKELKSTIMDLKEENGKLSSKILELENMVSMKDGKISQLEKLVDCYSSELESIPNVSNISKQLESSLKICDELRVDNFHLKQKLADECKKFHDLKEWFIELRNGMENMKKDIKDKEKVTLIEEKNSLECTLLSLSEEVEFLSQKNEQFLRELQNKDFYEDYKAVSEELNQLRKAHLSLIDLIEGKEINIDEGIHPLTTSLLRKWKRENFLNASLGRVHSNSVGAINVDETYNLMPPNNTLKLNKASVNGKRGPGHQHSLTSERFIEGEDYNTNYMMKENTKSHNEVSAFSRIFNWGGFDNAENNYELSVHQAM